MPKVARQVTRRREVAAWELRQQGKTERAIAQELGVCPSTVHRALVRVERRVSACLAEKVLAEKERQTRHLERLLAEALDAWERSKRFPNDPGCYRPLWAARDFLRDLRELWGLDYQAPVDVPAKVASTNGGTT